LLRLQHLFECQHLFVQAYIIAVDVMSVWHLSVLCSVGIVFKQHHTASCYSLQAALTESCHRSPTTDTDKLRPANEHLLCLRFAFISMIHGELRLMLKNRLLLQESWKLDCVSSEWLTSLWCQ